MLFQTPYLGDTEDPDSVYQRQILPAELKQVAEAQRQAGLSIEQKEAEAQLIKNILARATRMKRTTVPGYTVAGPVVSPIGKEFQLLVLARDWPALFTFLPPKLWGQYGMLGKYSFVDEGGQRTFIPFTEAEIRRFVFSPYYTVQPGWVCTDEQRELGVAALWQAAQRNKQKFASTDWRSISPIYPGWGSSGQQYGCEKPRASNWVRIRGVVAVSAAVVAAVYLGPIVLAKMSGAATAGATEAATTGIVGAGTKAGVVTAITTKAGAAAAITTTASTAAATTTFFQTVQSGANTLLNYVNQARTIEAIAKGEMPPPPISVVGDSFTDWAMIVVKEQIVREAQQRAMELGTEYIQRKLTEKEEARLRAEIKVMQAELARLIPNNVIASPDSRVPAEVQAASAALALKEKQAQDSMLAALAIAVPVGFLLLS